MPYATIAEVQALIAKFTLSATTTPTTTQATALISDISDEIDSAVSSKGVAVPVTAPAHFLNALGLLNAYGAAAAILKSMFPDTTGTAETPAYAFWERRYQKGLESIRDGSMIPPDAATNIATVAPSTYFTRNPDTEEDLGDIAEPLFKRDKVF